MLGGLNGLVIGIRMVKNMIVGLNRIVDHNLIYKILEHIGFFMFLYG